MPDMNEQEIQEMINLARAGDAEANYRMSQWALDQAVLEPEEERWNRLAAKCLVRAAEAGYGPAQERMEELIRQLEDENGDAPESGAAPEPPAAPQEEKPRAARSGSQGGAAAVLSAIGAGAASVGVKIVEFFQGLFPKDKGGSREGAGAAQEKQETDAPFYDVRHWSGAQWKRAQRICLIVILVLALVLVILWASSRSHKKDAEPDPTPVVPQTVVEQPTPAPTPTPEPVLYPDEQTRAAIAAANLDAFPDEMDYVTEATTATVNTNSELNLRRSNSSSGGWIASIPSGTVLDVYAYKSGSDGSWALVKYGDNWGWCSANYLR